MSTTPSASVFLQFIGPENVHKKGLGGKQTLHLAVEYGDFECIVKVLAYGASPNAADDDGVTPFHLSCHQRGLSLLKLLLIKGADVNIVDNAGWGPIQHAVQGANVRTVHYLVEVCGLSLRHRDNKDSTLLHIACDNRCKLVFNYLLRYQRSDVTAVDADGNTALHFAARSGWIFACSRLLSLKGDQLLPVQNTHGDTPYAVATKAGHIATAKALAYYSSLSWISPKTDLQLQWYLMLLLPVIYHTNCVLTAGYISHQTTFIAVSVPFYIAFHAFVMHNFGRIGGWVNPITAGLYGWGCVYTLFIIYQYLMYGVFKEHPFSSFVIVIVMSLYSSVYYALLRIEPSACTISTMAGKDAASIKDLDGPLARQRRFCGTCEIVQPPRARHCFKCGYCYYKRVKHSNILHRCITADNQGLYTLFLLLSIAISVIFFGVIVTQTESALEYRAKWWSILPLIIGHYLTDVYMLMQLRHVLKKVPFRRLWWRQITTGDCRIL